MRVCNARHPTKKAVVCTLVGKHDHHEGVEMVPVSVSWPVKTEVRTQLPPMKICSERCAPPPKGRCRALDGLAIDRTHPCETPMS